MSLAVIRSKRGLREDGGADGREGSALRQHDAAGRPVKAGR
jgi:hypothetical protein